MDVVELIFRLQHFQMFAEIAAMKTTPDIDEPDLKLVIQDWGWK